MTITPSPPEKTTSATYKGPVCRGDWSLGNNCKICERCIATRPAMTITPEVLEKAEMIAQLRQLARKQEGYGMSFSDPSPRDGGIASINLYGDRAKAAIWLFKNADRIAAALLKAKEAGDGR